MMNHLPRHQLERLAAEDPDARVRPVLRVHVAACDLCQTRLRALHAAKSRFLAAYSSSEFARDTFAFAGPLPPARELRDWSRELRVLMYAGLVAVFATAFLWYGHEAAANWVRVQGGTSFRVFAVHAGRERRLLDGDELTTGDELAFEYSLDRPRHLLLLGVDDTGSIRRYYPPAEAAGSDTLLAASTRSKLPARVALDARVGEERLYALFSDSPVSESDARLGVSRAVGAAWATGRRLEKAPSLELPVQAISVWFRKR
ncbi:MAG TPA: DUF4384 domain-containing protein [Polyangiales bacterium]|jgi:hypothetical protein|nr:DUF4384 domain-containing protein [Polyangiales bacterium]